MGRKDEEGRGGEGWRCRISFVVISSSRSLSPSFFLFLLVQRPQYQNRRFLLPSALLLSLFSVYSRYFEKKERNATALPPSTERRPLQTRVLRLALLVVPAREQVRLFDGGCETAVCDEVEEHDGCFRGGENGEGEMRMVAERVAYEEDQSARIE
jgi:hypothetical protein